MPRKQKANTKTSSTNVQRKIFDVFWVLIAPEPQKRRRKETEEKKKGVGGAVPSIVGKEEQNVRRERKRVLGDREKS